jgi:hypothetical protein
VLLYRIHPLIQQALLLYYISATSGNNIYHTTDNSAITSQTTTSNEGLSFNLDAGNTSSYPGSGSTWSDLIGNLTAPQLAGGFGSSIQIDNIQWC